MENKLVLNPRAIIFKEGADATKLYMVKRGEVLCLKSSKDRIIPVFLAQEGDIVGESAMIEGLPYTYSAITLSNAELVEIPAFNFKRVFMEAPAWLVDLTTTMIHRFQSTANLIAENRVISPLILTEDQFSTKLEVEFKKLLAQ
ncbi:MAG TPA: cyclic nucleotide-binding domain-containing protein [Bacteriovoracaceae bacterium]|nr:cyclic nucleotide-binding domain-containing protein [Bacteriovoracaceae bacterium]